MFNALNFEESKIDLKALSDEMKLMDLKSQKAFEYSKIFGTITAVGLLLAAIGIGIVASHVDMSIADMGALTTFIEGAIAASMIPAGLSFVALCSHIRYEYKLGTLSQECRHLYVTAYGFEEFFEGIDLEEFEVSDDEELPLISQRSAVFPNYSKQGILSGTNNNGKFTQEFTNEDETTPTAKLITDSPANPQEKKAVDSNDLSTLLGEEVEIEGIFLTNDAKQKIKEDVHASLPSREETRSVFNDENPNQHLTRETITPDVEKLTTYLNSVNYAGDSDDLFNNQFEPKRKPTSINDNLFDINCPIQW